ncbi:MAG: transposase [Methylovirgula sp.]
MGRGRGFGAEPVVRTLSAFVAASVNGLVRDAILAGPPLSELAIIAEHAGCGVAEAATEAGAVREALILARGEDLLILHAGHVPELAAIEEIGDLAASGQSGHGWLLRAAPNNLAERFFPRLTPPVGLLAARRLCEGVGLPSLANLIKATRAHSARGLRLREGA